MGLFTFDPFRKYIKVKGFAYTIDTASSGGSTVTVSETIDPDTPQEGLLMLGTFGARWGASKDLTSGYDWASNNEFIYISTFRGGPEKIILNANCADLAAVISHINDRLTNGGLFNHGESIICQAGDGTYTPTTNIEFVIRSGYEGECFGIRFHDPTDLSGTPANDTLGVTQGTHLGVSDEYGYESWTGSIFTLDSGLTLSENYNVGYSAVVNQDEISILDMYSEAMDWSDDPLNQVYDVPMDAYGNFAFGGGQYSDSIFRTINDWVIQPFPGYYQQIYTGTIIPETAGESITTPAILGAVEITFRVSTHGVVFQPVTEGLIAQSVWDTDISGYTTEGTAGETMYFLGGQVIHHGLAQTSTVNTITLASTASSINGNYDPSEIVIIAGAGVGQSRIIYQYDGTNKIVTVDRNWKVQPDTTSYYIIRSNPGREHVNEGLAQGGTTNTIILNAAASDNNDTYVGQSVFLRSGTGEDQVGYIIAYDGSTHTATVEENWSIIPDTTTAYVMLPQHQHSPSEIGGAVWDAPIAEHLDVGSTGEALNNVSAGASPTQIAEAVWDSLVADNIVTGSFGEAMKEIQQVSVGRWRFDNTAKTLTVYDIDDSTPLVVFDMKDINGSPTLTNIYERVRQ